ncbi:hypothetical protein NDU88_003167 [Pleurodeles waltl]|uniref:Uncharacterized protein n=1 Tax=Pleurodeles waltl TaxID=8319 RepID=A0AAV7LEK1_PLEWA|nr:hypothetical protein NDU88_003167 [Pleurodeles waltl]
MFPLLFPMWISRDLSGPSGPSKPKRDPVRDLNTGARLEPSSVESQEHEDPGVATAITAITATTTTTVNCSAAYWTSGTGCG